MAPAATNWKERVDALGDLLIRVDGKAEPYRMSALADITFSIDFTLELQSGETPTNVATKLYRWRAWGEAADTDATAALPSVPSVLGNTMSQRVTGSALERGRFYALEFAFGASGNHRSRFLPIEIAE